MQHWPASHQRAALLPNLVLLELSFNLPGIASWQAICRFLDKLNWASTALPPPPPPGRCRWCLPLCCRPPRLRRRSAAAAASRLAPAAAHSLTPPARRCAAYSSPQASTRKRRRRGMNSASQGASTSRLIAGRGGRSGLEWAVFRGGMGVPECTPRAECASAGIQGRDSLRPSRSVEAATHAPTQPTWAGL